MKAHTRLLLALLLGAVLGVVLHPLAGDPTLAAISTHVLRPIGQIFLRSIFMVVVPLVVSALIAGVYELGQGRNLPGVGLGLSLVAAVAEAHGGRFELGDGPGVFDGSGPGLRAAVVLPSAT